MIWVNMFRRMYSDGVLNNRIVGRFDRRLGSIAADTPDPVVT